jgi:threonine/homoserine/homoserine lactone efflux protein
MGMNLVGFCVAAFVLIVTPGPNFFYILTRGATQGRRAGVIGALGLGAGVLIHTSLATLGVAAIVRSSYLAFRLIKYGGSLYLLYLGFAALRERPPAADERTAIAEPDGRVFWQSVVASMTNPKTILFFLSFLPQFVTGSARAVPGQMLLLGGIYMFLTVTVYSAVAHVSGRVSRWLRESRTRAKRLRWVTATSFLGLGVWAALPDRR